MGLLARYYRATPEQDSKGQWSIYLFSDLTLSPTGHYQVTRKQCNPELYKILHLIDSICNKVDVIKDNVKYKKKKDGINVPKSE